MVNNSLFFTKIISNFRFFNTIYKSINFVGYHHIPERVKFIIESLYTNFKTEIPEKNRIRTSFISVGRGVLQGDCLGPLLFSMCFNTFIQLYNTSKLTSTVNLVSHSSSPTHWFQFADGAAVLSSQESENTTSSSPFLYLVSMVQHDHSG